MMTPEQRAEYERLLSCNTMPERAVLLAAIRALLAALPASEPDEAIGGWLAAQLDRASKQMDVWQAWERGEDVVVLRREPDEATLERIADARASFRAATQGGV